MTETNIRTFTDNWTGTGTIEDAGDAEHVKLDDGEYMESEIVYTGTFTMELLQNVYDAAGDDVTLQYRHAATEIDVATAEYNNYSVPFMSLGYVQVKLVYP